MGELPARHRRLAEIKCLPDRHLPLGLIISAAWAAGGRPLRECSRLDENDFDLDAIAEIERPPWLGGLGHAHGVNCPDDGNEARNAVSPGFVHEGSILQDRGSAVTE